MLNHVMPNFVQRTAGWVMMMVIRHTLLSNESITNIDEKMAIVGTIFWERKVIQDSPLTVL